MTAHQRFPSDRLRLPGERAHNPWTVSLDVAVPMVRLLFWLSLLLLPFVVILCNYSGQP